MLLTTSHGSYFPRVVAFGNDPDNGLGFHNYKSTDFFSAISVIATNTEAMDVVV